MPGGSGGPNFTATVKAALRLAYTFTFGALYNAVAGLAVTIAYALRIATRPAFDVTTSMTHDSIAEVNPGIDTSTRLALSGVEVQPAANIVQIRYDLTRRVGADVVTQEAHLGRSDWATITNAQGLNGVGGNATFAGSALGVRSGRLVGNYANVVNKAVLAITSVKLHFYVTVAGTLLDNAEVQLTRRISGSDVVLQTITGNSSSVPITHDITAAIGGNWANIDSLEATVIASAALSELWTATVDAIELEIIAFTTDTL